MKTKDIGRLPLGKIFELMKNGTPEEMRIAEGLVRRLLKYNSHQFVGKRFAKLVIAGLERNDVADILFGGDPTFKSKFAQLLESGYARAFDDALFEILSEQQEILQRLETILKDFDSFMEGIPSNEKREYADRLTADNFQFFKMGADWIGKRYGDEIRKLLKENKELRQRVSDGKERTKIASLMKECLWRGKPNWTKIGGRIGLSDNGARAKAKRLGLIG